MVKVYIADTGSLEDEALFGHLYRQLPGYRRERIDRIKMEGDRQRSLGGFWLLRHALLERGIVLEKENMAYETGGKPFLKEHTELWFNVSHSGSRVMCAVADKPVGCDVEQIKDTDFKVAKRFFHETEYAQIMQAESEEAKRRLFFRIWTRKESYVKMTGQGMRQAFDSFLTEQLPCSFREYDRQDGYCYTCCSKETEFAEQMRLVDLCKIYKK